MKNLYKISLLPLVLGFSLDANMSAEEAQRHESAKELMVIQPCPNWCVENTEKAWTLEIPIEGEVDYLLPLTQTVFPRRTTGYVFRNKQLIGSVNLLHDTVLVKCYRDYKEVCSQEFKIEPSISDSEFTAKLDPVKGSLIVIIEKSRGE